MKYTREYCLRNKVALYIGIDRRLAKIAGELSGHDFSYLQYSYGDEQCVSLNNGTHCSRDWFLKNGWELIYEKDLLQTYEIY